jgi:hypothetical protein
MDDSFGIEYWCDGSFHAIPERLFRKYTNSDLELAIATLLQAATHPHIVQIYQVADDHYDMELLQSAAYVPRDIWATQMSAAKSWLQAHGIAYIDWRADNTGVSHDGAVRLFDFDASALQGSPIPECELYREATQAGVQGLWAIDDWAFARSLLQLPQAPCDPVARATPA